MARSTIGHFLRAHDTVALQRGQSRQLQGPGFSRASRCAVPTAAAARIRVAASPGRAAAPGSGTGRWWRSSTPRGRSAGFGVGDQPVIDERAAVLRMVSKRLPHRDLLLS